MREEFSYFFFIRKEPGFAFFKSLHALEWHGDSYLGSADAYRMRRRLTYLQGHTLNT